MSKEKQIEIEVITYEQDRLNFFTDHMHKALKKYRRIFKKFNNAPYLSEEARILSDVARETHFYEDVVEMLEQGYRKQSENTVEVVRCKDCDFFQMVNGRAMCSINAKKEENLWLGLRATVEDGFCHRGAKMKGGAE